MIHVDGSAHSGSGTVLRYSVALATVTGTPLHVTNIRKRRPKPGLRAQHVQAVRVCAVLSGGRVQGDTVGSDEILYEPGNAIRQGFFQWDIGTAGSAVMLAFTLIPPALFARGPCTFHITGGLFQDFAPTFFHMDHVLVPWIRRMGADVRLRMIRPGYVPKGGGRLEVRVTPLPAPLLPVQATEPGSFRRISGIALSSHLEDQRVSDRMARRCTEILERRGFRVGIERMDDRNAVQKGAALCVWTESDTGALLGADQAGARGRSSESIGETVAASLIEDLDSGAATDRHLADQLILFAALAAGRSRYRIPEVTDHIRSNLWLVEELLGASSKLEGNLLTVDGTGLQAPPRLSLPRENAPEKGFAPGAP